MKMDGKTKKDANSANDEFMQIRQRYKELRLEQRKIIIEHLEKAGFTVQGKNGGRGIRDYTSGRRFQIPYDLSNWLWINVEKYGRMALISLQSFDQDPNSKNYHVLMDRIGIFIYNGDTSPCKSYEKMEAQDIDLPMDEKKLGKLIEVLNQKLSETP